eukprot:g1108.t1
MFRSKATAPRGQGNGGVVLGHWSHLNEIVARSAITDPISRTGYGEWDCNNTLDLGPPDDDEGGAVAPFIVKVHVLDPTAEDPGLGASGDDPLHCPDYSSAGAGGDGAVKVSFDLGIGEGRQTFRWLALTVANRYANRYKARGRLRQREQHGGRSGGGQIAAYLPSGLSSSSDLKDVRLADLVAGKGGPRLRKAVPPDQRIRAILRSGDQVFTTMNANGRVTGWHTAYFRGHVAPRIHVKKQRKKKDMDDEPELQRKPAKMVAKVPWSLARSVWAPRVREADSAAWLDNERTLKKAAMADLAHTHRIEKLVKSNQAALEELYAVIVMFFPQIWEVYRLASCSGSNCGYHVCSWNNFTDFYVSSGIVDEKTAKTADLDRIFVTVNVQKRKEDKNNSKAMTRFEFLEALVRIAMLKFMQNGAETSVAKAFEKLCREHVAKLSLDSNEFRSEKIYKEEVDTVFQDRLERLTGLFSAAAGKDQRMDIGEWSMLMELTEIYTAAFTEKQARIPFVLSNPLVIDEHTRSQAQMTRDRHTHLRTFVFHQSMS